MGGYGPMMDVKVLYTLDTSPHHTMVARLGYRIPVQVVVPTPLSPLDANGGHYARQVRFGRVPLKACLSAVCMASPELMPDDKRDYIIYAVDPEETFRAQQQTTPPRASVRQPSFRDQSDAGPSKLASSSPVRPKESIFVGKGFFNWALEEQGEGDTTVSGRVRSDGRSVRYENGREYEEDINILEVVIKLKESQARNKDRHVSLVRNISSHAEPPSRNAPLRASRMPSQLALHSEPDYPTSCDTDMNRDRRLGQAVPVRVRPSTPAALQSKAPATASEQTITAMAAAAASNPQALQLLSILQSLQQRSAQSAPEPAQQAQLETLLQQVAMALVPAQPAADSTSVAESTDEGKKGAKRGLTNKGSRTPANEVDDSVSAADASHASEDHKICYNCGAESASTWRNLQLPAGSLVNHPNAERPARRSDRSMSRPEPANGNSSDDNSADDVPRYAGQPGPVETDGETRWSACNPCGIYYVKWKYSRPEYVWRAEHVRKGYKEHTSKVGKRQSTDYETSGSKRVRAAKSPLPDASTSNPSSQNEKETFINKKLLDRKPVWDEALGKYRSRRSIRENPSGNRPGRPKGSGKTGKTARRASLGDNAADSPNASAKKQAEHDFRAPLPPQTKPAQPRTVNFAQSSPIRPSNASRLQSDSALYHLGGMGPLQSPSRDVRFRVPSYLMNSSPGTMMDTLMSEADFDFGSMPSVDMLQTPGTLLGNLGGRAPLRRSPRKNPLGTISGQNPYASPGRVSPTFGKARGGPLLSSNDSPVTRSRTKSGQDVLHPALFSSSDDVSNPEAKSSSTVTSPASPSLKGKSRAKSQAKVSLTRETARRATSAQSDDADEDDSEDNAPEARLVKGPYQTMGGGGSSSREGSVPACPRSPSLARSVRQFARNLSSASIGGSAGGGSPASHWSMQNGRAKLASLDLPPSSPCFDHPTGESNVAPRMDAWGRTASMREMFPTPSELDWPSDGSPAADTKARSGMELVAQDRLQVPSVVRRRPLPATVEDASSSVSGSSPASSEASPDASDANLFDLLEDPYGILAASGFGIDATGALSAVGAGTNAQLTPTHQPTVSADNFNEVQLHKAKEYGNHLNEFHHSGSVGLATHAGGEAGASVQHRPASIASTPNDAASPKTLLTPTLDASFLSSLPPELSSIFASPKKPLPPRIVDILTSPRKPKSVQSPPNATASSPSASGALVPYGFENSIAEADLSALFNNPDIQAMLAEFDTTA